MRDSLSIASQSACSSKQSTDSYLIKKNLNIREHAYLGMRRTESRQHELLK